MNDPELQDNSPTGADKEEQTSDNETKAQENPVEEPIVIEDMTNASLEDLVALFQKATQSDSWFEQRNDIQKIMDQFEQNYTVELQEKKKVFLEEGGNPIDFFFRPAVKEKYDQLTRSFRQQKRKHYQAVEQNQKVNQERKEQIIEEIKELIGKDENLNSLYTSFKNLQDSWYKTGPAPRNINNNLWQTYKHHVERFYDFVHLNRELRAKDYEHNYKEKLKIIEKAESLADQADIVRAGRDLDRLHRQWKEDLGPVAKEHREELWQRFQEATAAIHKRKQDYQKNFESIQQQNLETKEGLLQKMLALKDGEYASHNQWQKAIQNLYSLREDFKQVGPVPKQDSKRTWATFRDLSKAFNQKKNDYYRELKSVQREHIQNAKKLLEEVNEILESDNWRAQSNRMKNIQKEWKNLGPIPRKLIVKMREEFHNQCNLYFDRLKSGYQKLSESEKPIYESRQQFISEFEAVKNEGDSDALVDFLNTSWEAWGKLPEINPQAQQSLNTAFQKSIDKKIKAVKGDAQTKEKILFDFKRRCFADNHTSLNETLMDIKGKYESILTEINQLENNLQFFSDSSDTNPLVKDVKSKIDTLNTKAQNYQEQLSLLRADIREFNKKQEESSEGIGEEKPTTD